MDNLIYYLVCTSVTVCDTPWELPFHFNVRSFQNGTDENKRNGQKRTVAERALSLYSRRDLTFLRHFG
jgi:hypothetical protein